MSVRSARYNLLSLRNPKGLTVIPEERDAWAFLDAAAITSSRQQRAVIELVRGLKHAQLWTKMKAIYPFVGGTATTHKYNLKDPRDVDAAYRLSFSGGWTHSANGADPNGTNAYANTFLIPQDKGGLNDTHISFYSREDVDGLYFDIGTNSAVDSSNFSHTFPRYLNTAYGRINAGANTTYANSDSLGYYIASRSSSTTQILYKNGIKKSTGTVNSTTLSINSFWLGATNNFSGGINYFSPREQAFATIGDGLTDTDATNLYNIVQRFQTTLGRQV